MRIGLFGGTFNPIHSGHIRATQEVKKAFSFDKIYLIPSALPPHKKQNSIAEAKYRLEMVRLSISTDSSLYISDVELKRSGPSYHRHGASFQVYFSEKRPPLSHLGT